MTMLNLAGPLEHTVLEDVLTDGPGLRVSLFLCGCPHHCPGCQNPHTWDSKNGEYVELDVIINRLEPALNRAHCAGLTISGGEPFLQPEALTILCQTLRKKRPDLSIWIYTGYTYEQLAHLDVLKEVDVLVDGKFEQQNRYPLKSYRGSRNQRLVKLEGGKLHHILDEGVDCYATHGN